MKILMKRYRMKMIGLVLLLTCLVWIKPAEAISRFSDLKGHWAQEAVLTSYCCDLIKGYPDQSFKPDQDLSQMEALVLFMKAQGYSLDKVKSPKKGEPTRNPAIPVVPWGQNYLDAAVEKQLLPEVWRSNFKHNAPASREQVAFLLGRLLSLPAAEPASSGEDQIRFSDLADTSPEARAYIGGLNQYGIMSGFADGTFRPGQALKRGEAAVVLVKLLDGEWNNNTGNKGSRQMEGWVKSLSLVGKTAELELASLQGVQKLKLDPQLICFRDGQECFYQEAVNSRVRLYLNQKKQVSVISILGKIPTPESEQELIGTVKSVVLGEDSLLVLCDLDCKDRRLPLAAEASLESLKTQSKGFKSLKTGTFVKAYLSGDKVVRVSELKTLSISGTVQRLSARTLNLEEKAASKNKPSWFNYWDRARVVDKDGNRMGTVFRGDKVQVTYLDLIPEGIDDELPLEIIVSSRPELKKVKGLVESIVNSTGSKAIVIKKNKNYPVDEAVAVSDVNGAVIPFTNLKADNEIEMSVDGAGVVMKVKVLK